MIKGKVSAIICAAGSGTRAGLGKNKLLAPLYGAPLLYRTLEKFAIPEIDEVIVTSSERDFKEISALCAPFGYAVVLGGETRTASVKAALSRVTGEIVLIHDGARPYCSRELISRCIASVKTFGSGICAVPFTDTAVNAQYGEIHDTLDRDALYRVQTPQGFYTQDIVQAYSLAGGKVYTDDSAVYAEFIAPPRIVSGEESNVKITYASDFPREYAAINATPDCRAGIGVDVHAFGSGNAVTLCGVRIEHTKGLIAHSDGDVALHAVTDAYLSAAGLRDIGYYFPDTDEALRGADSGEILKKALKLVSDAGFTSVNLSLTIQAEEPRLSPHIDKMKKNTAKLVGIPESAVAIAAGTCEHLGFVGKGLGITAYAAVTVKGKDNGN